MTVLELIVVITIIAAGTYLLRSGFRAFSKADMVENATELSAVLQRTSQLAIETGEMHRVVIDLDPAPAEDTKRLDYQVERCLGQAAIMRNEAVKKDAEETERALAKGKQRLDQLPEDALAIGDVDTAMQRMAAVAGHHVSDRTCTPAIEGFTGDARGKPWGRSLARHRGIKFKQIWVQHLSDKATKGEVAIYFFPTGSAEKAVVEMTDGSETYTILVHGLTGRVELRDGTLRDPDDHMLRNVLGDKDAERETAE